MSQKKILRKKYYYLKKKNYYEIKKEFFFPLIKFIKSNFKKKDLRLALYYPSNFELNSLKFLDYNFIENQDILIPVIEKNNNMHFYPWKKKSMFICK